jgi:hydrogenase maturation protease
VNGVLVAGVGNIFRGDDGVGSEVARRLLAGPLPDGVRVLDIGIRALHLGFELLDGADALIVVDAMADGREPGTVSVVEPVLPEVPGGGDGSLPNPHEWSPDEVLALIGGLANPPRAVYVVGVEPAYTGDALGLSEPVAAAVATAATEVLRLAARLAEKSPC